MFGLKDNDVFQSKTSVGKPRLGQAYDDSDDYSKASEDKWKVMKFYHFPNKSPHSIKTVIKDEQKVLFADNNELLYQRLLFNEL